MLLQPFLSDLFARLLREFQQSFLVWLMAVWVGAMLCIPRLRNLTRNTRATVHGLLIAATCIGAVIWAWSLLWASDDAYISFRYAENLAKGHGLVFNPGERVEGYTDFLWTVIAAAVIVLKGDPGQAAIIINLASFVGLILLVEKLGKRLRPAPLLIGVAPLLIAANYTMASFATACIETMFAAFLVTLAIERVDAGHPLAGGFAGVAAALTHPDHGIFYAVLGLALLLDRKCWKSLVWFAIPFLAVFVPYFLWRWSYYGDLMPNTFYAKSANKVYFEQGTKYLLITLFGAGFWLSLPLVALGGYQCRRTLIGRYALLVLPIYLLYVAKVGGDFMLGRFFVPAIPVWILLADAGYRWLLSRNHWRTAAALVAPATVIALPITVVGPGELYQGVADERSWVNVRNFSTMEVDAFGYALGNSIYRQFTARGLSPKFAIWCIGMSGYYSKVPVFDMRGLTSRSVAHLPIGVRGRPGHEKVASAGLVVESKSDLSEIPVYPAPYARMTELNVAAGRFHLVRYEPKLLRSLPHGTGLRNFTNYLDNHAAILASAPPDVIACDLWQMREYYFTVNLDEARKLRLQSAAAEGDPTLRGIEPLLLEPRELSTLGYKPVRQFTFANGEPGWSLEGDAAQWLTDELRPEQEYPLGRQGRFVNTFAVQLDDAAKGRMQSPEFTLQGDVISLWVGGGHSPDLETVRLIVDHQEVRRATGCDTEWLGQRVWNVAAFKGKTAQIVIEDQSQSSWGHLLVDEIVEWQKP